jgi:hypothetical protein
MQEVYIRNSLSRLAGHKFEVLLEKYQKQKGLGAWLK